MKRMAKFISLLLIPIFVSNKHKIKDQPIEKTAKALAKNNKSPIRK
jgi:hypothetical protein